MAWDREKRGIFQRKQEKPQIKKHKPLDSEGNDGDITIRQLDDGVFMFFKALGKWYKTLNAQSQIIPETPNARSLGSPDRPMRKMYVSSKSLHMGDTKREQAKISLSSDRKELVFTDRDGKLRNMIGRETGTADETDVNNDYVTVIGKDNITNAQGWLALGSGASDLGGVIQGAASLANTDESGYLGLRVLASSPTNKKQFTLGAAMISPFSTHKVAIGTFNKTGDVSIGGFIDIAECALDPPTAPPAGSITLYAKSDGLYVYQDSSVTNLMGTYLPLAGGSLTGGTRITNTTAPQFILRYDTGNHCAFSVDSNGATTIATTDSDGALGHLNIEPNGHVEFDGCGVGFDRLEATYNATTTAVDFRNSNKYRLEISGNITNIALTFPATSGNFLLVCDMSSSNHTVTNWKVYESDGSLATSAAVLWAGGDAPTFTDSGIDILSFYWDADEQQSYGTASLAFEAP